MLDFISSWVEDIAIAIIIASIFELIIPQGKSKKYIKMILGVYIVFTIISPFVDSEALYSIDIVNTIDEYTEDTLDSVETSASMEKNLNEIYIETLEEDIISEIEEQGYEVDDCIVDGTIYSEDEDEVSINSVYIKIKSKNNKKEEDLTDNIVNSIIENIEEININIGNTSNSSETEISSSDIKDLKEILSEYLEVNEDIINIEY